MVINPYISFEELHHGLVSAFNEDELKQMLRVRFDINLDDLTSRGPLPSRVFSVIEAAERAGWLQALVEAAYRERPRNARIKSLYERVGLAPQVVIQQSGKGTSPAASAVTS